MSSLQTWDIKSSYVKQSLLKYRKPAKVSLRGINWSYRYMTLKQVLKSLSLHLIHSIIQYENVRVVIICIPLKKKNVTITADNTIIVCDEECSIKIAEEVNGRWLVNISSYWCLKARIDRESVQALLKSVMFTLFIHQMKMQDICDKFYEYMKKAFSDKYMHLKAIQ